MTVLVLVVVSLFVGGVVGAVVARNRAWRDWHARTARTRAGAYHGIMESTAVARFAAAGLVPSRAAEPESAGREACPQRQWSVDGLSDHELNELRLALFATRFRTDAATKLLDSIERETETRLRGPQ